MKTTASLLLVDDDRQLLASMSQWLMELGYAVDVAGTCADARAAVDKKTYDLALVDVRLPDGDGFDVLEHCRQNHPELTVVLITGYGSVDAAVDALRAGAFDFLTKPLIDDELEMAISRALNQRELVKVNKQLTQQLDKRFGLENIVGHDTRMQRVFDMVASVADTKASVLMTGESGTGKSLIARAIHRSSQRRNGPFVEVACGALPENLLESELFGHVAGAFTGAVGAKIGKFKLADGGTIFLDEIGTASPGMQVKLLRVLQELEFEPVGGTKTEQVDVRVILATNEDLEGLVAEGKFRMDLFYRVNVINILLPPLRERTSDIPTLAEHFLEEVCQESGKPMRSFSPEAIAAMQGYSWPGNVRELQNCVERAVLLGKNEVISPEDFPATMSYSRPLSLASAAGHSLKEALEGPERQIILDVLESNGWNRQTTADQLGINRTTLYKKMKRLGLEDGQHVGS
jgi:DNA-binding NtrC family response regulator